MSEIINLNTIFGMLVALSLPMFSTVKWHFLEDENKSYCVCLKDVGVGLTFGLMP